MERKIQFPKVEKREKDLEGLLNDAPHIKPMIMHAKYFGPCSVLSLDETQNIGPAWLVPDFGWIVVGVGITRNGILISWKSGGVAVIPSPVAVYLLPPEELEKEGMEHIKALSKEAEFITW